MYIESEFKKAVIISGKIDFRKRFDGLLGISYMHGYNPYEGDCLVFVSRDSRQVRVFFGDQFGLYLVCRRFDGSSLKKLLEKKELSHFELSALLQGAHISIESKVKPWRIDKIKDV